MNSLSPQWSNISKCRSKSYICGFCNENISSELGYLNTYIKNGHSSADPLIYICHLCQKPTFFDLENRQFPGVRIGQNIKELQDEIKIMYNESRDCFSVNSFTASAMCSRKLLMNVAVNHGASENKTFQFYVDYLFNEGYIPKNSKEWVDEIRKKGNEATHKIQIISKEDATELIDFAEFLLKILYEYPAKKQNKVIPNP